MAVAQLRPSCRARRVASLVALSLAAGSLAALATSASAATTKNGNATPIYLGNENYVLAQPADIEVPASGTLGQAATYPSEISVPHTAKITDLDINLQGLTSTAATDLDVLLVGPGGQQALLMSDVGNGDEIANVDITLDDEAGMSLTASAITPGTYKPSNNGSPDQFDAPAPAASGNTLLSVFDGVSAAGVWKLFVMDDTTGAVHRISGWQLEFTLATSVYPSSIGVAGGEPAIADVNVGLEGVSTTFADGIHLLLVGPGGQQAYLWGDAGGPGSLAAVDVTFDDEAASALPDENQIVSGSYRPAQYGTTNFPVPAPVPSGGSSLTVFDGLAPNGHWQLFAFDDADQGVTLVSGWWLELTWSDTVAPAGTVNVNGGAASTTSRNVTLSLSATDPGASSGLVQMRFSNDGVTFSAYQQYATRAAWVLAGSDGTKTVYAQFKDGDGNVSAMVSDTIHMDVYGPSAKKLNPNRNAKDIKTTTKVKIKASEALNKNTITKKTVLLKQKGVSDKVKVTLKYNATSKTIVLTPIDSLQGDTKYKVTVNGVQDAFGHRWDEVIARSGAQPLKYSFKTA